MCIRDRYKILGENLRDIKLGGLSREAIDIAVYQRIEKNPDYKPKNVPDPKSAN